MQSRINAGIFRLYDCTMYLCAGLFFIVLSACSNRDTTASVPLAAPLQAQPPLPIAAATTTSITVTGLSSSSRRFLLYVPAYLPPTPVPVVFMLHGYSATPELTLQYDTVGGWNTQADVNKFIVVYPASESSAWRACGGAGSEDVVFMDRIVDLLTTAYPVDRKRIYAAGHSQGAMMVLRLAQERSTAYAAVYANEAPFGNTSCGVAGSPVPMIIAYGTSDTTVSYAGNADATLNFWLSRNQIQSTPVVATLPDLSTTDMGTIEQSFYRASTGNADIVFWKMIGAGHAWPNPEQYNAALQAQFGLRNQDIDGAAAAWQFFRQKSRP